MNLNFFNERIISAVMVLSGLTIFSLIGFDYDVFDYIIKINCLVMVHIGVKNYFKGGKWSELSNMGKSLEL